MRSAAFRNSVTVVISVLVKYVRIRTHWLHLDGFGRSDLTNYLPVLVCMFKSSPPAICDANIMFRPKSRPTLQSASLTHLYNECTVKPRYLATVCPGKF